jgi:DNA-binding transcriptional LysR family regulator
MTFNQLLITGVTKTVKLNSFSELKQFHHVAKTGSISKAAIKLNLSAAAVSNSIKRLESSLSVQLFNRNTRALSLTEVGESFLVGVEKILMETEKTLTNLSVDKDGLAGGITVSAPSDLVRTIINDCITQFLKEHPKISINVCASDSLSNLHKNAIDVAIRYGVPKDSTLISRSLYPAKRILCASPAYLHEQGAPAQLSNLKDHSCLCYYVGDRIDNSWKFGSGADEVIVDVAGKLTSTDSSVVRMWAVEGKGIIYKSELDVKADIEKGRLVHILEEYNGMVTPLNVMYPSKVNLPARIRLFIDSLISHFKSC